MQTRGGWFTSMAGIVDKDRGRAGGSIRVRPWLLRIIGIVRLSRLSTAFAAVANVWFVILWTRAREGETAPDAYGTTPLPALLASGALMAVALYAFAACLNDVVDASRDRALKRDRPISAGQVSAETASVIVAVTLIAAVLGASVFGSLAVGLVGASALAALVFNVVGTRVPAIGMLTIGVAYATHMITPNAWLRFLWPVWLVMTHALIVNAIAHVAGRKRPSLSRRAVGFAVASWALVSAGLYAMMRLRAGEGELTAGIWPTDFPVSAIFVQVILAAAYGVVAYRRVRATGYGPRAADKVTRYGALWISLYACGWLYAAVEYEEAAIMTALAVVGFVGMSLLRMAYAAMEHPSGYRR